MPIIAVIGLGYVGLPLALAFAGKKEVIGYDTNEKRIQELKNSIDRTGEVAIAEFTTSEKITFTNNDSILEMADVFIVTVPTPVDEQKVPDLTLVKKASETVASRMRKGAIVIYESTVYPGASEEFCAPILEEVSGLKFNQDFFLGYSPERINPGDARNRLKDIVKVTSGSTEETASFVDELYSEIINAGTYSAPSIKVAEAAKVIENTQRDLNIALVNELSIIFNKLDIDTNEVLDAAATKWNFMRFTPGLVGGHCIGVDPYYLTHKSKMVGYSPEVILAGRRINDKMGSYIASNYIKILAGKDMPLNQSKTLIMGFSFKENCSDIRNTKVIDIYNELMEYNVTVEVYDPIVDQSEVREEYAINIISNLHANTYDGIILAVNHSEFKRLGVENIKNLMKDGGVFLDLKSTFDKEHSDFRL